MLDGNIPSSVIRAVITRWTAHYLAYSRLINLRPALMVITTNNSARVQSRLGSHIITGNVATKNKAERMIAAIVDPRFWSSLTM